MSLTNLWASARNRYHAWQTNRQINSQLDRVSQGVRRIKWLHKQLPKLLIEPKPEPPPKNVLSAVRQKLSRKARRQRDRLVLEVSCRLLIPVLLNGLLNHCCGQLIASSSAKCTEPAKSSPKIKSDRRKWLRMSR